MPEPGSAWLRRKGNWHGKDSRTRNLRGRAGRPLPITKIAFVVPDIDDALEKLTQTMRCGPWNVYKQNPPALLDSYLRDVPTANNP
jgi:hypothetical protein